MSGGEDPGTVLADIGAPEDSCAIDGWNVDGKIVQWNSACSGRYRGPATGRLTFDGGRGSGELTIAIEDGRGARHPVRYRIEAVRRGECAP